MCNLATFWYQKCVTLPKKDINKKIEHISLH